MNNQTLKEYFLEKEIYTQYLTDNFHIFIQYDINYLDDEDLCIDKHYDLRY